MRVKLLCFLLIMACAMSLQAQTSYYIDAVTGSDETGTGSVDQPWATINGHAGTWRNTDCKIYLAPGSYIMTSTVAMGAMVEIVGTGKDQVFIEGLDDDSFMEIDRPTGDVPNTMCRFFEVTSNMTVAISGVTLRNLRLGDGINAWWAGMISVEQGSKLIMKDVDVKKAILRAGGGAGIDCKGSLELTRVSFSDCYATMQGAAISLAGTAEAKFEGCVFERNTGTSTVNVYPVEGVSGICADLRFNNCLFKENDYTKSTYAAGIAIGNFNGYKMILHITNSTFDSNMGHSSGCIFITTDPNKARVIDMMVQNCTFAYNTLSTAAHGVIYSMNSGSSSAISGDISFVNNTFFHNDRPEGVTSGTSEIFFSDMTVNYNYINNISLIRPGVSWGMVMNYNEPTHCNPTFKGNIFEAVGGTPSILQELFLDPANGKRVGQSADTTVDPPLSYIPGNDQVKLETTFTSQGVGKAPFLRLGKGSAAIDAGYDDGGTLVPSIDVRGVGIQNEKKDAGAYESDGATSVGKVEIDETLRAFVNRATATIVLSEKVNQATLYSMNGGMVKSIVNSAIIPMADLSKGTYILHLIKQDGGFTSIKIQR